MAARKERGTSLASTLGVAVLAGSVAYLYGYFVHNPNTSLTDTIRRFGDIFSHGAVAGSNYTYMATPSAGKCTISELFADQEVPGMHLACVTRKRDHMMATVYMDGHNATVKRIRLPLSWMAMRSTLEESLGMDEGPTRRARYGGDNAPNTQQPWAMFTPQGDRIASIDHFADGANDVIIYEGGNFIWPGVRVGHEVTVERVDGERQLLMRTVSMRPLVFSIDGFLYDKECEHIQRTADPYMAQSGVALMDHDKGKAATDWRTSATHFLRSRTDKVLQQIDRRVRDLTRQPISHQEDVQVLRYSTTQRYDAHHDYFDRRLYSDEGTISLTEAGRRNRMATVLWYLSDVQGGGETIFPMANGAPEPADKRNCDVMGGIRVPPRQGRVIMFYSLLANGDLDAASLHASCAVREGTKWAANKWVWNKPIQHILHH